MMRPRGPKPSPEYQRALALSREQHLRSKTYSGNFLRPHRHRLKALIEKHDCRTALDYGCGKAHQYEWLWKGTTTLEQYWGIPVTKYDPAYPPLAAEPVGSFDLVICSHVLTLIPIPDLEWVIPTIFAYTKKVLFIVLVPGGETKNSKAKWRTDNTPDKYGLFDWMDLLKKHKSAGVHVVLVTRNPGEHEWNTTLF